MNTLFAGNNTHVLNVDRVRDSNDNAIQDAEVSATLYEYDGTTPVAGFSWPLQLTHGQNGNYQGILSAHVAISANTLYIVEIIAQKELSRAEWRDEIAAQQRRFDD